MAENIAIKKNIALDKSEKYEFFISEDVKFEAAYFYIPMRERPHIACISTQIGCKVGCLFCAAPQKGFIRNLSVDEIVMQIEQIVAPLSEKGIEERLIEISYMGMGEPLNNLSNVLESIKLCNKEYPGINRVTISTTGSEELITELMNRKPEHPPIHLQLSLHATNDDQRRNLMPGSSDNIEGLLRICKKYSIVSRDKVCLNYILLDGINNNENDIKFLRDLNPVYFYVKLTILNPVPGIPKSLKEVSSDETLNVAEQLLSGGLECKIFRGDGLDINASCGQMTSSPIELPFNVKTINNSKSIRHERRNTVL
jgi:23S rRNA (adenine2503-C2)-methyltransferase